MLQTFPAHMIPDRQSVAMNTNTHSATTTCLRSGISGLETRNLVASHLMMPMHRIGRSGNACGNNTNGGDSRGDGGFAVLHSLILLGDGGELNRRYPTMQTY